MTRQTWRRALLTTIAIISAMDAVTAIAAERLPAVGCACAPCQTKCCLCPDDYCCKPLPPVPCVPPNCCCDNYCCKPLPPVPCVPPNCCCDNYCPKPMPCVKPACFPWHRCGCAVKECCGLGVTKQCVK